MLLPATDAATEVSTRGARLESQLIRDDAREACVALLVDLPPLGTGVVKLRSTGSGAAPEREPADLRLRPGTAAVDAGQSIYNVNYGFVGKAPDLGAYELGSPMTHYGPRPRGVDEETGRN